MNSKKIILLIILAAIIVVSVFLFLDRPFPIMMRDKQIIYDSNPLKVTINYPYISGLDDFNQKVKTIIEKEFNDFKTNSLANGEAVKKVDPVAYAKYLLAGQARQYELNMGYDKGEIDNNIISVVFNVYTFEGGAHGASYFVPLNYDVKNKKEITLADIFPNQPDYLQKISDYCTTDLTKQLTEKLGNLDGTSLKEGAGPKEENFQFLLINHNNTITFYFPQYQVAFGAAGDFKVVMPR